MVRIPAAKIATCTARCAMRRKIDCGMSNSAPPGRDQTFARVPAINGLKHPPGTQNFRAYLGTVSRAGHIVRSPPYSAIPRLRKGNCR